METTTIEVTAEQRDYLKGMAMGSHKSALQELIDSYESDETGGDVDLSPVLGRIDDLEAQLPRKVARELQE